MVEVSSWAQMQELFKVGTIKEYTYFQLTVLDAGWIGVQ